ncbi:MAG: thiamine phosphate synthase [Planctomycetota bacterium]
MASAERHEKLRGMRVYALLTSDYCRLPVLDAARGLLEGGADVLQLREKSLEDGALLERADALREMTAEHDALFIVNDRPDVAVLCGADGVHLGDGDLPPERVRELVGPDMIIGLSTHNPEQAGRAADRGADYIGVGPVFPTETKGYTEGGGTELVRELCGATDLPTVALGGITAGNAGDMKSAGATAVAACRALCGAEDPAEAAREFSEAMR